MGITYRSLWEASGTVVSYEHAENVALLTAKGEVEISQHGRRVQRLHADTDELFLFLLCLFLHSTVYICYKWAYRHTEVEGRGGGKHKTSAHTQTHTDKCLRLHKYTEF